MADNDTGVISSEAKITTTPFPASKKVYREGSRYPDIRVPMREIALTDGSTFTVYDTSGPYTDPDAEIDVTRGLPALRSTWIENRGDTTPYEGRTVQPEDNGYSRFATRTESRDLMRTPRRAVSGANVSQMHYARRGEITAEMEYVAIRENMMRENMGITDSEREQRLAGRGFGARIPQQITPEFVRDEIAAGRAIIPANINHPELEPVIIGRNFLVKVNANIGN
jgi:phosphomethylpyrimidine synthase